MQHNGQNTLAQLSRNIHRLGLELRSTRNGWMVCKPIAAGLHEVKQDFATLVEAAQWIKGQYNGTA